MEKIIHQFHVLHFLIEKYGAHPATWVHVTEWAYHHEQTALILTALAITIGLILSFKILRSAWLFSVRAMLRMKQGAPPTRNKTAIFLGNGSGKFEATSNGKGGWKYTLPPGEVFVPQTDESKHIIICGTTGSGKTQLIHQVLLPLNIRRQNGQDSRAVILDLKGDFLQHYFSKNDLIFNPLDRRCLGWNLFSEIRENTMLMRSDLDSLSEAILPPNPRAGANKFFEDSARNTLIEMLEGIYLNDENPTNGDLQHLIFSSDYSEIHDVLSQVENSQSAGLFAKSSDNRLADSVMAELRSGLKILRLLDSKIKKSDGFSFRRWGLQGPPGQWIFLTRRVEDRALLSQISGTILSLIIDGQMSADSGSERPISYILDEVSKAGRIPSLVSLLDFGRSKKASAILGIQNSGQLEKIYGKEDCTTIIGQAGTLVILRQGDAQSATLFANMLGKKRGVRQTQSHSGDHNSTNEQYYDEHIYSPTNLMHLRGLSEQSAGQGLVRLSSQSGLHPRPISIRICWQGGVIPPAETPSFCPGGKTITWEKKSDPKPTEPEEKPPTKPIEDPAENTALPEGLTEKIKAEKSSSKPAENEEQAEKIISKIEEAGLKEQEH